MSKASNIEKFTFVSLFAGTGIVPLALEHSGFENLGIIKSRDCNIETIYRNKPFWSIMPYDCDEPLPINFVISYLNFEKNKLDLLTSVIYLKTEFLENNKINESFFANAYITKFLYYLKNFKPKMFLINFDKDTTPENFKIKNLKSIKLFMEKLDKLGYEIFLEQLDSYYYGVSQKTKYLVIVGIKKHLSKKAKFEFPKKGKKPIFLRSILRNCPESIGVKYSQWKKEIFEYIPQGGNWTNLPDSIISKYNQHFQTENNLSKNFLRRLKINEVCPTINILPKQVRTDSCHPFENRPLNIRESARCKSIPDSWEFVGDKRQQYKQIAKAIPFRLVLAVSKQIKEFLTKIK